MGLKELPREAPRRAFTKIDEGFSHDTTLAFRKILFD
jgi:hypothetical protein